MSRKKVWKLFRTGLLQDLRALEAEEVVCEVERVRAGVHADAVRDADVLREALLEAVQRRPAVKNAPN